MDTNWTEMKILLCLQLFANKFSITTLYGDDIAMLCFQLVACSQKVKNSAETSLA